MRRRCSSAWFRLTLHTHTRTSCPATEQRATTRKDILKQTLVGNSCMFPVAGGHALLGGAQDVYLAEFDGPQRRTVYIEVMGE